MMIRYGSNATVSDANSLIKSGQPLLFVFKYSDLGASSGNTSKGWTLTESAYNFIVSSGITEAELDAKAIVTVTAPFTGGITFAGTEAMQMVPMGRNNSTPSFIVDEFRMGTNLADVVALEPVGEGISSVLNGEFNPWNTVKWSNWYDNCGHVIKPFILDTSVTFADYPFGDWNPKLSGTVHLFEILDNMSYQIDGNGTVIDVCQPQVANKSLTEYYAASASGANPSINRNDDWHPWTCFYVDQGATTVTAGTMIENFLIAGFSFGVKTKHSHQRTLTVKNCEFYRNVWAFFARGKNVSCISNTVAESFSGGVYGEYNSCNWQFLGNDFHDNQVNDMAQSFGDIVLDSCYDYLILSNSFGPAYSTNVVPRHHTAVSMFRNAGENRDIREHAVHDILIRDNTFDSYHLAVDIAARMGVVDEKDMSLEGRCYVHDIIVENNLFTNCIIGAKVNSERNDLTDNRFTECEKDIVLHCVFYKNINNLISQANGSRADVWLWSQSEDYELYSDYCFYQKDGGSRVHESITDDNKLFHVVTNGQVTIHAPSRTAGDPLFTAQVVLENDLVLGPDLQDMFASGATPVDIAVADYAAHLDGDEVAVIWDTPVSVLNEDGVSNEYYSIIIYDQWGLELDRCGRSTQRWARIAGGNMLEGKGFIHDDDEAEIAAIFSGPEKEVYPVYIFRRGFALSDDYLDADRVVKLLPNNTLPWVDIAVGNFTNDAAGYDEIALISSNASSGSEHWIHYCKPSDAGWSSQTTALSHRMHLIAAGNFDTNDALDEIAGTYPGDLGLSTYPVDLFKVGDSGGYLTNYLAKVPSPWTGIAAGNFDPADSGDEVAVAASTKTTGYYRIGVYDPVNKFFKKFLSPIMGVPSTALDAGAIQINSNGLALTEQTVDVAYESNDAAEITSWGDFIAVLPLAPQTNSIPLFWTNVDPQSDADMFWRTVPLYR